MKPVVIDPKTTPRAAAFDLWMDAPNPMVTFFKTLDVTPLIKYSRRHGCKFNMLLCWCIGRAAGGIEAFYSLPVGRELLRYDSLAVNTIVKNETGEVSSCDVPFSNDLAQFNADYLRLTHEVAERCENHDLPDSMVIGTSAIVDTEIDGAVGMNSGIFNNPFLIWGRYHKGLFKTTLRLSFQFHHTQMDGATPGGFWRAYRQRFLPYKSGKEGSHMKYVLETNALCKRYRDFTALNGLDMHIPKGAIYGFVGRNGAGKTTLIRLLCGLQEPTGGSFTLYGVNHTAPGIERCRRRMGAVVESPAIYPDMTAEENLRQQHLVLGLPAADGAAGLLHLVGLDGTGKKKAKDFSLGMRQRLGIAIALAGNPDFLVLDEPVNGLDPQGIIEMRELILKLNREHGITVLISSHILDELSRLATHYGFIDGGHMVREMSAAELESCCRKCMRMEVSDTRALSRVLDRMQAEYRIADETHADVYAELPVTELVLALAEAHCTVRSIKERDESLESFYMNLIGGEHHA